jgi:hypothetical protein
MTYTPSLGPFSTDYTDLNDGDALDAASVRVWLEALSDSLLMVKDGFITYAGNKTFAGDLTFTNGVATLAFTGAGRLTIDPLDLQLRDGLGATPIFERCVGSIAIRESTNANWFPMENTLTIGASYLFPVYELPNQSEITAIKLTHNPDNATSPLTKVAVTILRVPRDASGAVAAFTAIADPATGSGYTDLHVFTATPASPVPIDLELNSYFVRVISETGGSAIPGVLSAQPVLVYRAPFIDLAK